MNIRSTKAKKKTFKKALGIDSEMGSENETQVLENASLLLQKSELKTFHET